MAQNQSPTPNDFSDVPKNVVLAADFLRSGKAKIRLKEGILAESRVEYFKGKSAMKAFKSDAYKNASKNSTSKSDEKHPPSLKTDEDVADLLSSFLQHGLIIRVEREAPKSRVLRVVPGQTFAAEAQFVWVYQGSQLYRNLLGLGIVMITLAGVMFPLWPVQLRIGVWYISVGLLILLGVFFGMVIVRAILWLVTYIVFARQGLWLFPNLFEDVSVVDSFKPVWGWDQAPGQKGKKKRSGNGATSADSGAEVSEKVDEGADGDVSASGAER
ncbi:translocation protein [Gonapodya prolifera JEL478]|uniref:Translocation protein SEC62 n=1 Tax=Gonapodya prolifera (strain JEL478) TaxID=1344416 RepID=A0A139AG56_GONPJ|nr:translocation protein [Gonapodya prolifera JEL478]|eukprot:KXS15544.1 translocation protein [Gonapodya prolifera JEL478]